MYLYSEATQHLLLKCLITSSSSSLLFKCWCFYQVHTCVCGLLYVYELASCCVAVTAVDTKVFQGTYIPGYLVLDNLRALEPIYIREHTGTAQYDEKNKIKYDNSIIYIYIYMYIRRKHWYISYESIKPTAVYLIGIWYPSKVITFLVQGIIHTQQCIVLLL